MIGLGGLDEIGVGVDPHPGQPAHGDGGDDDGAGQQNDGLEGLRDHDRPQAADGRVDHRDDRDRGDGRQRRNAEELLEHGGAGVQADADVDEHRRHDEHEGKRGPGGGAVAPLHELGQRLDAAAEVDGHEDEAEQDDREARHPLEVPHGHADAESALREPDQVDRGDVRSKESGAHHGPLQIAAREEVRLAGMPVDLADGPQADEQDAQQVDDDDEEIDGRDGHWAGLQYTSAFGPACGLLQPAIWSRSWN